MINVFMEFPCMWSVPVSASKGHIGLQPETLEEESPYNLLKRREKISFIFFGKVAWNARIFYWFHAIRRFLTTFE